MDRETIGEFSRRTGLSVRALRLYDELGVLRPAFVDPRSGYRLYDASQAGVATLIRLLRASDFPLPIVSEILGSVARGHPAEARHRMAEHWASIEERHERNRAAVASLHHFIDEEAARVPATIPSATFAAALEQLIPAAGEAEECPVLMSVLFEGGEAGLRMVATDSFRMAVLELPGLGVLDDGRQVLIPAALLRELCAVLPEHGNVALSVGDGAVTFDIHGDRVVGDTLDAAFPDYRSILNAPTGHRLATQRQRLLEVADSVQADAADDVLALDLGETITARIISGEGDVRSVSNVEGSWDGPPMVVGIRPRFLADGLRPLPVDDITLLLTDPFRPIRIGEPGDDFTYVLMPVPLPAATAHGSVH